MRVHRLIAAIAALATPLPALSQTVNDAFECKLPYRATMEAAATLKVLKQSEPMNMVIVTTTVVELDPGSARVYGHAPTRATLVLAEPDDKTRPVRMSFQAHFARTPAMETALFSAVKWKAPCGAALGICWREADPAGTGKLMLRLDSKELKLECEFEVREQDLK